MRRLGARSGRSRLGHRRRNENSPRRRRFREDLTTGSPSSLSMPPLRGARGTLRLAGLSRPGVRRLLALAPRWRPPRRRPGVPLAGQRARAGQRDGAGGVVDFDDGHRGHAGPAAGAGVDARPRAETEGGDYRTRSLRSTTASGERCWTCRNRLEHFSNSRAAVQSQQVYRGDRLRPASKPPLAEAGPVSTTRPQSRPPIPPPRRRSHRASEVRRHAWCCASTISARGVVTRRG